MDSEALSGKHLWKPVKLCGLAFLESIQAEEQSPKVASEEERAVLEGYAALLMEVYHYGNKVEEHKCMVDTFCAALAKNILAYLREHGLPRTELKKVDDWWNMYDETPEPTDIKPSLFVKVPEKTKEAIRKRQEAMPGATQKQVQEAVEKEIEREIENLAAAVQKLLDKLPERLANDLFVRTYKD